MQETKVTIRNKAGIHCRPSGAIMTAAANYPDHSIEVVCEKGTTELKSILDLLSLGLQMGDEVTLRVSGPQEEMVCAKLAELFSTEFDFV